MSMVTLRPRLALALRLATGLAVLGSAVLVFIVLAATKPEAPRRPEVIDALAVQTVVATVRDIALEWEGYGSARAMDVADVDAEVAGLVVQRPAEVEPGLEVARGQTLVVLDRREFASRVEAIERTIDAWNAQRSGIAVEERRWGDQLEYGQDEVAAEQREVDRMADALAQGAGSSSELEQRRARLSRLQRELASIRQQTELIPTRRAQLDAQLAGARAELAMASLDLERATITAPISGVLQRVDADLGERLAPGVSVARIVDLRRIEIPARLPISAAGRVRVGDHALLRSDGASAGEWRGRVSRIAPEGDASTRTMTVFVEVVQDPAGAAPVIQPGQFLRAVVQSASMERRVIVPRRCVESERVMVVDTGVDGIARARRRAARVARHADGRFPDIDPVETQWAVLEDDDLAGAVVVASNLDDLHEGATLRPTPVAPAAPSTSGSAP